MGMLCRRALAVALAASVLVLVACGSAAPARTAPSTRPARAPLIEGEALREGPRGWAGAEQPPEGLGGAVTWTGRQLVVAGYGTGARSGHLRVAVFTPETGDWTTAPDPLGTTATTGPALGHDEAGNVYLVAGECGPDSEREGDDTLGEGDCPYHRRHVLALVGPGWRELDLPGPAQDLGGDFVGSGPTGAVFEIGHRPYLVTPDRVTALAPPPRRGMTALCMGGAGLLAVRSATGDGDPAELTVDLLRAGSPWAAVTLPPELVSAAGSKGVVFPSPGCGTGGVTVYAIRGGGASTAFTLRVVDGSPPAWSTCALPAGDVSPFTRVAGPVGSDLTVAANLRRYATSAVLSCAAGRSVELRRLDAPVPDLAIQDGHDLVLVTRTEQHTALSIATVPV